MRRQKRSEDQRLPNGSVIQWSSRKLGKVTVYCGSCGSKRRLFLQNVTAIHFTGLCRGCAYRKQRTHTDQEVIDSGSIVYWNERRSHSRNELIPVRCGICGRLRGVAACKIPRSGFTGYCPGCGRTGSRSHLWKGGRFKHPSGYILVRLTPEHPLWLMADSHHLVPEHRLIMAHHVGRPLRRNEIVHHKNGVKDDNRLENLELLSRRLHHTGFKPDRDFDEQDVWEEVIKIIHILLRKSA